MVAHLVGDDTKIVQRPSVIRLRHDDLPVQRLSRGKSPGLVVLEGEFEGLLDRYGWHAEIADRAEGSEDGSA
jgi:hypothetical protein